MDREYERILTETIQMEVRILKSGIKNETDHNFVKSAADLLGMSLNDLTDKVKSMTTEKAVEWLKNQYIIIATAAR